MPAFALAAAASSPEYHEQQARSSRDQARETAFQTLRYACFTHDTGPEDCIRPRESWGRIEPAGTKWSGRGRGFFRESQCGIQAANLAQTAYLLQDLLTDDERSMLAAMARDYRRQRNGGSAA